jgi:hypothetical protein
MKALQFAAHFLSKNHPLRCLPVCTFYEYLASVVCADLKCTLDARMLKAKALLQIGFIGEASEIIVSLYAGKNIPELSLNTMSISSYPILRDKLKSK